MTFLDSASISLMARPVQEAVRRFDEEVGSLGTIYFDDEAENAFYNGVREAAARLIQARPEDVATATSATEVLCQIAWWLRPGKGRNVVSIDVEFPSVAYPWLRVAEDFGCEVRLVEAKEDPTAVDLDRVAELIDESTAAVCVSHVQYATGHRLDLDRLSSIVRQTEAILIVDVTQSAGAVPVDVGEIDADFVMTSGYKWICGPCGSAFCWVRPEIQERFRPPFVGWRSTGRGALEMDASRLAYAPGASRMEYATISYSAGAGLKAAVGYLLDLGVEAIEAHNHALGTRLIEGLDSLDAHLITPRSPRGRGGIVTARLPGDNRALAERLRKTGRVRLGTRLGALRFSPHFFNDESDIDRTLEALETEIARGV